MNKNISDQLVEILVEAGIKRIYSVTGDSLNHVNATVHRSLGMVKLEMEVAGIPDLETDMLNPDFTKIAEAMGMPGITIIDPGEVKTGLEKAFLQEGPVLVTVQTDPNALAMPPKLEFDQMKGFALYMGKMMLSGRMGEIL